MVIYGWDASHYDWDRGKMDIAAAIRDGIAFATHKVGEGSSYADPRFAAWYTRARSAGVPLLGGYYVLHPGNAMAQADRFLSLLDSKASGWRNAAFILQVDAEKFEYMSRAPNRAECRAFCDRLVSRTSGNYRPLLYAPKWVYGNNLTGVGYPLWASNYGNNPVTHYRSAYPGDNSSRWNAYSGQTPALLQYGSRTKIASQSTCDVNAFRGTLDQLRALVYPKGDADMPLTKKDVEILAKTDLWRAPATAGDINTNPTWTLENHIESQTRHGHLTLAAATRIEAALAQVLGRDPVNEQAIVDGVLTGLGSRPVADVAAVLRRVMSAEQLAALAAELATPVAN